MTHQTRVVVAGVTGHQARCACGWVLDCVDAMTATRECWAHVRHAGPVEDEEVPF